MNPPLDRAQEAPQTPPGKQSSRPETVLTPQQVKRLGRWGQTRRKAVQRAWAGTCSPRAAVRLFCLDCCGEDVAAVRACGDRCCPLWRFRPFQPKEQL